MRQLAQRSLARVGVNHPLRLVDLTGAGLARLGTTAAILSGPHQASRAWSRALWLHPGRPDGLLYRARHDPSSLCAAIFDRAEPAVRVTMLGSLLAPEHRASLGATLRRYDFSLRP